MTLHQEIWTVYIGKENIRLNTFLLCRANVMLLVHDKISETYPIIENVPQVKLI